MKPKSLCVAVLIMLASAACTLPDDLAPPPTATPTPDLPDDILPPPAPPTFVESNLPASIPACAGEGLNLVASYEIEPEGISHVVIRYRLNGGIPEKTSPWTEFVMMPEGILDALDHFRFEYPDLGADAAALFAGTPGVFEFMLLATDNDGESSKWPTGNGTTAEMELSACPEEDKGYQVHEYGVSSQQAGYGPGCSPTELVFEVIVSGYGQVQDAWLRYEYSAPSNSPAVVSPSFEIPLQVTGEGQGFPGSTRLALTVDVGAEANTYMAAQDGFLSYNMYVRLQDNQVFEYPYGGPPMVSIESCLTPTVAPLIAIPLLPTPSPTPLRLAPAPTAIPIR